MPTHRPRTLDNMYGTGITPNETPHVERVVDAEEYSVDINLTPAAGTLLETLATAIAASSALRAEWFVLMHNRPIGQPLADDPAEDAPRRDLAVRELLTNPKVRQALTIRLTPMAAELLMRDLDQAALEPDRCDQYDHGDRCTHYAAEGETTCPRHLPADPQP